MKLFFFLLLFGRLMVIHAEEEPQFNFGKVEIQNSGSPKAQFDFLQGLAALHSFEYQEALIDFKKAEELDPNFALAYWGEAMAHNHAFWREQNLEAAREVLQRLKKIPEDQKQKLLPKEQDLIAGLDVLFGEGTKQERDQKYTEYMAQLYEKYPNDPEIISLYALSILGTIQPNEPNDRKHVKAASVVDAALGYHPPSEMLDHPGMLHYYIHALDDPINAGLALKAANRYASVAPDSAHALHMPSHIYVQLGMWDKARQANIESYDASILWVGIRKRPITDRQFHSLYWLMYANLQMGRYREAKQNVEHIIELMKKEPSCQLEGHWALIAARYMVETKDCLLPFSEKEIQEMGDCYVSEEPQAYSFIYAMGNCALLQKDFTNADFAIKSLEELRENLKEKKTRTTKLMNESDVSNRINILTIEILELNAIKNQINGNMNAALDLLKQASEIEEKMALPNGIPVPVQSSLGLYGRYLLLDKQWEQAKLTFQKALDRVPNRAKSYLGIAVALKGMGDLEGSKRYANKALGVWKDADTTFPELEEARSLAQ